MQCECCQDDNWSHQIEDMPTTKTLNYDGVIKRVRVCNNCGLTVFTEERITEIQVFNHILRKKARVTKERYVREKLWSVRRELA